MKNTRNGFTLIELIVVIAILSIISTLAVNRIGAIRERAARMVSVAAQQSTGRAVESFLTVNDGKLNRLDALVDAGTSRSDGAGYDFNDQGAIGSVGGLYRGPDDVTTEAVRERNSGLWDEGDASLVGALCLYRVNGEEAAALRRIGLHYVLQHNTFADGTPYSHYGAGDDGAIPQPANGLDPELSACIARTVTNGVAFAAVNGKTEAGRAIFRACGQDLLPTATGNTGYNETAVKAEIAATGGPLLAFGLGANASIIGAAKGGLDSVPCSEILPARYYRQYILLFRLRTAGAGGASSVTAEFAGVLDPRGNSIVSARQSLKE
jgi:prepilin-type N-terminal cleavage/methylation domain-containing protein